MKIKDVHTKGSLFVYSEEVAWFDFGPDHPFKPERAAKTFDLCSRYGLMDHSWMRILAPSALPVHLLTLFHEPEYLALLLEASAGNVRLEMVERGLGLADNPILPGVYEWSLLTAGGTLEAMRQILRTDVLIAFNPLGGFHHGMPGRAEGFCYLNDVAIAILYALRDTPELKIAYLDFDAHHGNGVQEAFYRDSRVFVASIHETGKTLYPGSGSESEIGEGEGEGFTLNFPLEPGSDDEIYDLALREAVFPLVSAFGPDLIVAVIGADTLISDPLTHLRLTNNSYQRAVAGLDEICPRILALGGGGYDLYRTARCWTLAWALLNHIVPKDEFAGVVGGMMFGPEIEVGSLYDHPVLSVGDIKHKALEEAQRVLHVIQQSLFPIHGISP